MMEQANAAEGHHDAVLVAGFDDLGIADAAAGFHNGSNAAAVCALDVVAEGEEGIAAQADTGDLVSQARFSSAVSGSGWRVKVCAHTSSPITSSGWSPM